MEIVELEPGNERLKDVYPVMHELRTGLSPEEFKTLYEEGYSVGYRVAGLFDEGECKAAAGFHISHGFNNGMFMYIDDLVTKGSDRSRSYGTKLLRCLEEIAFEKGCRQVHLDSGTQRRDAHRFYFREGYTVHSFHFVRNLEG